MKYKSGDIYQIKLPFDIGYAYGKITNFLDYSASGLLLKVFDVITDKPTQDISMFNAKNLFFGPRSIVGLPRNLKEIGVTKIANSSSDDDFIVPDFKDSRYSRSVENESAYDNWYSIINFSQIEFLDYERVKHLELPYFYSIYDIIVRTVMEYCKTKKMNVEAFYDISIDDYRNTYYHTLNTPIYKEIPLEYRGITIGFEKVERDIRKISFSSS